MNIIRRAAAHEINVIDERVIRVVASTTDRDAHDTIIQQDWNRERFNRNPVFLWMHDMEMPPIGRVNLWESDENRSVADVQFAGTPFADEIFGLYRDGFLSAVSVGFMPGNYKFVGDAIVMSGNELLELSAVTIPSNAHALVEGRAAGRTRMLDGYIARALAPMLGRNPDNDDISLSLIGALPKMIEYLRNFETLESRVAELEKLKTPACEVVRVNLELT